MNAIVNATPMVNALGVLDNSTAQLPVQPPAVPDHLPHVFIWAQKGPTGRQLVSGDQLVNMYGSDTWDLRKQYATHQTVLATVVSGGGNAAQIIERLVPADAGPKANFCLWLDVLPTTVPVWTRNADGTIQLDVNGDPVQNGVLTTPGFKVAWSLSTIASGGPAVADSVSFGAQVSAQGTMTDGATHSTKYPILEFWSGYYGAAGNNEGLRLMAPLGTSDPAANSSFLSAINNFGYRLQAIRRVNANSTPKIVNTLAGEALIDFVLQTGQLDPLTQSSLSLGDVFTTSYQSLGNPLQVDTYAGIPNLHIYQSNISTVLALLFAGEKTAMTTLSDSVGADFSATEVAAHDYMYNLFTFRNSGGAQYRSILQDTTTAGTLTLSAATNLYCQSGSDGTISSSAFDAAVASAMTDYADPTSDATDPALNPVSIIYDTGFSLDTKYALCDVLAQRKDTSVILSTYTEGIEMTESQEASVAVSLRSRLNLYPESSYFGTPVLRGMIMARYGTMLGVNYSKKLPLTLWLAAKASAMMGAGNGVWNASHLFDKDPATIVDNFRDINVKFVPASQRIQDWAVGLNYPIPYDRDSVFYPALKTAYSDDTSVLTSFFAMMGCIALQKIGYQVWREYTGEVRYTRAQLIQNVNQSVIDKTTGKFAGLFKIVPKAFISGGDAQRGFSWTLPIEMYANNSMTVMTLSVEAYRMPAK